MLKWRGRWKPLAAWLQSPCGLPSCYTAFMGVYLGTDPRFILRSGQLAGPFDTRGLQKLFSTLSKHIPSLAHLQTWKGHITPPSFLFFIFYFEVVKGWKLSKSILGIFWKFSTLLRVHPKGKKETQSLSSLIECNREQVSSYCRCVFLLQRWHVENSMTKQTNKIW